MKSFNLVIITPEGELLKSAVYSIATRAANGALVILANHEPFFFQLVTGVLKIQIEENISAKSLFLINPLLVVDKTGAVITAEEGWVLENIDMQFALNYLKRDKVVGNLLVEALRGVNK